MTKKKLFYILVASSISYFMLVIPASFWILTNPSILKGKESDSNFWEWLNFTSFMWLPGIVLAGVLLAWFFYHSDNKRLSLVCLFLPIIDMLIYVVTGLF